MNPSRESIPARRAWGRIVGLVGLLGLSAVAAVWYWDRFSPPPTIPGENLTEGDFEVVAAVLESREAVSRKPKSADTWGRLGKVLHVHKFLDSALAAYAEAAKLDPLNPDWPYLRATIALAGPQPATAIPDLRRAAELGGLDEIPRLRLAELFLEQGRFQEASDELRRVLIVLPGEPRAHLGIARIAMARQEWADSLRHLESVGDVPSARKRVCASKLLVFSQLGDTSSARREQDRLARLPEDSPWPDGLYENLGYLQVGERARLTRAATMVKEGQLEPAIVLLREAVDANPKADLSWAALGRCLALKGDFVAAENALDQSLRIAPEMANTWTSLALVRRGQRNNPGTLECFRQVIRLKPNDAETHCNMGQILAASGDRAAAIEAFQQALRHRPGYREAQEGLDRLNLASPKP